MTCGTGEYKNPDFLGCSKCVENCFQCSSPKTCETCESNYYFALDKCVPFDECKLHLLDDATHFSCASCPPNCLYCDPSNSECRVCAKGYFLREAKCVSCLQNCLLCLSEFECLVCEPGFFLHEFGCEGSVVSLLEGFSLEPLVFMEESFVESVIEFDPKKTMGTNCFKINPVMNNCQMCLSGFYLDSSFECRPCPSNCKACRNTRTCYRCEQGYELSLTETKDLHCLKSEVSLLQST